MFKLTLNDMKQAYIEYKCSDRLWNAFNTLANTGFIDFKIWSAFLKDCLHWVATNNLIIDKHTNEIIHEYSEKEILNNNVRII